MNKFYELETKQGEIFEGTPTGNKITREETFGTEEDFIKAGGVRGTDNYWENVTTITPESLTTTIPIDLSGQPQPDDTEAGLIIAGTEEQAKMDAARKKEEEARLKKTEATEDITGLLTQLEGEGTEQLAAEKEAGLPEFAQQQADIQGQIGVKMAEYNVLQSDYDKIEQELKEQPGMLMGHFRGLRAKAQDQLRIKKNALASEIGILQAQGLAVQGKMSAAQSSVNRAIDLKYDAIRQKIETQKFLLDLISEDLTAAEKEQWDLQQAQLAREEQIMEEQKAEDAQIQAIMLSLAGKAPSDVLAQISNATSVLEATQLASPYLAEEAEIDTQIVTAGGRQLLVNKQTGETIRDLGAAYKDTGVDNDLTSEMKNYQFYYSQEVMEGRTPKSFGEWSGKFDDKGDTTLFDTIMQDAINNGASPSDAALAAAQYATNNGISLTKEERAALSDRANNMTPTTEPGKDIRVGTGEVLTFGEISPETEYITKSPDDIKREKAKQSAIDKGLTSYLDPITGKIVSTTGGTIGSFFGDLFGE